MKTFIFSAFMALLTVVLSSGTAKAETVTCTGTETITNVSYVNYVAATKTCTIQDAVPVHALGNQFVYFLPSSVSGTQLSLRADNNLDSVLTGSDHTGCTIINNVVKAAGVNCYSVNVVSGTYTNTIDANTTDSNTAQLSVTYTVVANTSVDITSASITVTAPSVTTSSGGGSATSTRSLQASVARSQTLVVAKNVGSRIANTFGASNPTGLGREAPGSQGRDGVSGIGRDEPKSQSNFSEHLSNDMFDFKPSSRTTTLKELALLASFDSSQMVLAAANEQQGRPGTVVPRADVLVDRPWTVWGHGSYTNVDNTRNKTNDDSRYNGNVLGYNIGGDYRLQKNLYGGVSLGFSQTDLTTTYNSGTYNENNWTLSPYAVYSPLDSVKLSVIAGYGKSNLKNSRDSGSVTGSTDSTMWFGSVNASYKYAPSPDRPFEVTAQMSATASHKKVDAYSESDGTAVAGATSNTRQVKPGFEVAYTFDQNDTQGTIIQPYAKADYIYDFADLTNGDSGAMNLGGGLRLGNSARGLNGSINGEKQLGRSDYTEYSISGLLAYGIALDGENNPQTSVAEPYVKTSFTHQSQELGAGIKYSHGTLPFSAMADISQSLAPGVDTQGTTTFKVGAELQF